MDAKIIFFSDRPARFAGRVSLTESLARIGFGRASLPNAAIELVSGKADSDVIVVELAKPVYDASAQSLSCEVTVLSKAGGGLAVWSSKMDKSAVGAPHPALRATLSPLAGRGQGEGPPAAGYPFDAR